MMRGRINNASGFTRGELVATISATGLLALTCLASIPRDHAEKAACANNLRQLGIAAFSFSDENNGEFPPRLFQTNQWAAKLKPYYKADAIVACPTGRRTELTAHSYLMNGWSDFFQGVPPSNHGMREEDIPEPGATILFGEKARESFHYYMDWMFGDDFTEIDHARHLSGGSIRGVGGSNYIFADGSANFLAYGASISPTNMWAVLPAYRQWFIFAP